MADVSRSAASGASLLRSTALTKDVTQRLEKILFHRKLPFFKVGKELKSGWIRPAELQGAGPEVKDLTLIGRSKERLFYGAPKDIQQPMPFSLRFSLSIVQGRDALALREKTEREDSVVVQTRTVQFGAVVWRWSDACCVDRQDRHFGTKFKGAPVSGRYHPPSIEAHPAEEDATRGSLFASEPVCREAPWRFKTRGFNAASDLNALLKSSFLSR